DISADHDISHDISADHDISHDISADHDISHDISADHDISLDSEDINIFDLEGINEAISGAFLVTKTKAPFSMSFSLYLMWFGLIGTSFYDIIENKILWLFLILVIPIMFVKIVQMIWEKIAKNVMYKVDTKQGLVGKIGRVKIPVSRDGGTISIIYKNFSHNIPVKALDFRKRYDSGELVYIYKYENGIYYVGPVPDYYIKKIKEWKQIKQVN
ncbi:MAG: hypothetical protein ACTSRZ_06380, partial [Promethearchaeota archaeon]